MRAWLMCAAFAAAGCFTTPRPNCAFRCGDNGECPPDYQCGDDQQCHLVLPSGLAECPPLPDASLPIDAGELDAPVEMDAMPDAGEDAMLEADAESDAPLELDAAETDGAEPDAAEPDAEPADAAPADAGVPDAAPPDAQM